VQEPVLVVQEELVEQVPEVQAQEPVPVVLEVLPVLLVLVVQEVV